jgi:CheY-like chemotaxis protein
MLEGDAVRLHQIISNLVQNAIKFTSEGKISVGLKKAGNHAQLIVKDTGIGIEPDVLPHIFERFRQADASTRRTHSGLGLGLTIVSNLVELHGGTVKAESGGKGQGSIFVVELPIAEKYLRKKDETDGETFANNSNLKGAKILLVDDDAESIVPLQMLLEREKAEVVKVFSAEEALAKLIEQPFHVLVSDIGMPEMDGYDLIAKIRQLTSEQNAFLPAIALTAYASNEDRRRALSAGFQMHFSKPFDFDELLSAIIQLYKDPK